MSMDILALTRSLSEQNLSKTSSNDYSPEHELVQGAHHGARDAHPGLADEGARLATFSAWPPGLRQCPKEMAEAGFFYEGFSDKVKCFSCDGGLEGWSPEDKPRQEHAKWFPMCPFITEGISTEEEETVEEEEEEEQIEIKPVNQDEDHKKEDAKVDERDESNDLEKKVQELRKKQRCKTCRERQASVVFLPCGHLISCPFCAPALQVKLLVNLDNIVKIHLRCCSLHQTLFQICSFCQAGVKALLRVYIS